MKIVVPVSVLVIALLSPGAPATNTFFLNRRHIQ